VHQGVVSLSGQTSRALSHISGFSVRDSPAAYKWTEIGVAFPHKDGRGFDILFDVVPLSGRVTIRVQDQK
jgi:hypothetical protein